MLTRPDDLDENTLLATLDREWGVDVASMTYRPVGFGSHHWEVSAADGVRWFLTVDELEAKRHTLSEPLGEACERLRKALGCAQGLRDAGCGFAIAPAPTRDGEPVTRVRDRFAAALYPFVDGESYPWGGFATPAHRRGVLDLVLAVHSATGPALQRAGADDFAIPQRDELESSLRGDAVDCGPYARSAVRLLVENAAPIQELFARYDQLVEAARAQPSRMVLTHGEPHAANTMRVAGGALADGWVLIDWDTALLAPPERDLWFLERGDASVLDVYAEATGAAPLPALLELYRLRWDLSDLAVDASRFRRRHTGSVEDDEVWAILQRLVTQATAGQIPH